MKKLTILFCLLVATILCGCTEQKEKTKMLIPYGIPLLGISPLLDSNRDISYEVTTGAQGLMAGFATAEYDVIVAPINLGLKLYPSSKNPYKLLATYVWGNYYLASYDAITSMDDLKNKTVTVFGKGSTPDCMIQMLLKKTGIENVSLEYVDDVTLASAKLITHQSDIVVTAEPVMSKFEADVRFFSLDEVFTQLFDFPIPQAGLFVKEESISKINLDLIYSALNELSNHELIASSAVKINESFLSLGVDLLVSAIPRCNLRVISYSAEVDAIKKYCDELVVCGLGSLIGEFTTDMEVVIPREE